MINNFNPLPQIYNKFANYCPQNCQTSFAPKLAPPLSQDCFQASGIKTQQTTNEVVWDNKKIEQIYNKVFDEVMNTIPVAKELNITKPELVFGDPTDTDAVASYGFYNNEIALTAVFDEDYYLCKSVNEDSSLADMRILPESYAFDSNFSNWKKTKLNDTEKELYISSNFAHELRHCIQSHLIASTKDCREDYINNMQKATDELKKMNLELIELEKELAAINNKEPDIKEYEDQIKRYDYPTNYKPKKIFTDDAVLKFSLLPEDNRYWSTKNHLFAKNQLSSNSKEGYDKDYYSNPLEIDAYRFQSEYLSKFKPDSKELRQDVFNDIQMETLINSGYSHELPDKYPPFVEKS